MKLVERLSIVRLAGLLVLVATSAIILAIACDFFDTWAPGVTTVSSSIALTLLVVREVERRAERDRLRPLIDRAHRQIVLGLRSLAGVVLHDAAFRPPVPAGEDLPGDARSALSWWLAGESKWDAGRGTLTLVLTETRWFTGVLDTIRELDRGILNPG